MVKIAAAKKAAEASGEVMKEGVSEYERARMDRIKRNNAYLEVRERAMKGGIATLTCLTSLRSLRSTTVDWPRWRHCPRLLLFQDLLLSK